ncbi:MAG: sensor histidine kinase [Myxococcota bacterium]
MQDRELDHLHRAEALLVRLRFFGMASWLFILDPPDFTAPAAVVWGVYAATFGYTVLTWIWVRRGRAVREGAIATTLLDGVVVAAICAVTDGITSAFFPYFYLTGIATSVRFGALASFAMLAANAALSIGLFAFAPAAGAPATLRELGLRLFYLLFATILGSVLSQDARENLRVARSARDRARDLLWRLIHAEEEERKRIAGDLHDRMGHRLFELTFGIDRCRRAVGDGSEAGVLLERLGADARACGDEIRALMNQLRPTVLDDFGASEAVKEYGAALVESGELAVRLDIDPDANAALPEVNAALFRILQEAVLNVRRHAQAKELWIELRRDARADRLELSVRDDGRGFDPSATRRGHYGLLTMRERAEACGGAFQLESAPGRGTRVRVLLPGGATA